MRTVSRALLGLIIGYAAGAALGMALVSVVSGNTHDKSVEAAMTAFFAAGPLGAIIGMVTALMTRHRSG